LDFILTRSYHHPKDWILSERNEERRSLRDERTMSVTSVAIAGMTLLCAIAVNPLSK